MFGTKPQNKKDLLFRVEITTSSFHFFTLGIAEPGPKSEFGQTSTENNVHTIEKHPVQISSKSKIGADDL